MKNIDMHFHSTASDGNSTEEEILRKAQESGVEFLALTDHDHVSRGFRSKAEAYGVSSCESVEISARNYDHNKSLHLTFYTQEVSQEVDDILNGILEAREGNLITQIQEMKTKGFQVDISDIHDLAKKQKRSITGLNKFDIARFVHEDPVNRAILIEINGGEDISLVEFYLQYLKREGKNFGKFGITVEEYEPGLEVCKQIQQTHDSILSIAHPNYTFKKGIGEFQEVLPYYIENAGVNAIEINSRATADWVEAIIELADKHELYLTFGSDNHMLGYTDNKHADLGELNPNVSSEFIQDQFMKYSHKLGLK